MPEPGSMWPPVECADDYAHISRLAAWYAGDKSVTTPQSAANARTHIPRSRTQIPVGVAVRSGYLESHLVHVPVAADLARTSADLLFGEHPQFSFIDDPVATERLDYLIDVLGLESSLPEAAELCAALSGIYWRVGYDKLHTTTPIVSWVQPDSAIPEYRWGELVAVTFWTELAARKDDPDGTVWRHLERHTTGSIEHALYKGRSDTIGSRVALDDRPETADLGADTNGSGLIALPAGVPMLAGYVPNMRPNRARRHSPSGRADIDQLEDQLVGVNDVWASWMRDLRLGKGRIIVPTEYLRSKGDGNGAAFDVDREVYQELNIMPPDGDPSRGIIVSQFAIRVADHLGTLRALIQHIVTGAGYTLASFGMDGTDMPATATEINARTSLSSMTREKKTRYWSVQLRRLLNAIMAVDALILRAAGARLPDPAAAHVEFADEATDSPATIAQTVNLLAQAQAASRQTIVSMIHPEWDEARVLEEADRIAAEQGLPVPDPTIIGRPGGIPVSGLGDSSASGDGVTNDPGIGGD